MKSKYKINSFSLLILLICLVGAGGSSCAPALNADTNTLQKDDFLYAKTLNTMASIVMSWYGNLITQKTNGPVFIFNDGLNLKLITDSIKLTQYPENIINIKIVGADLQQGESNNKFLFEVLSDVTFLKNNHYLVKELRELFVFEKADSDSFPKLVRLDVLSNINKQSNKNDKIDNTLYFHSRKLAYSWVAYLDGEIRAPKLFKFNILDENSNYTINSGTTLISDQIVTALQKRKSLLDSGRHFIRSVKVNQSDQLSCLFEMELIIDWKGYKVNKKAIAKIQQIIQYSVAKDGLYQIISIKEDHLLPDFEPWTKLLC